MQAGPSTSNWQQASFEALQKGELPPNRPVLARYLIHYADGQTIEVPLRLGESIHQQDRDDFFTTADGFFCDLLWAKIAWQGPSGKNQGRVNALYAMSWPNPRTNTVVTAVDILGGADATVVVFAIDADQTSLSGRRLYVATTGKDMNTGSFETPLASLSKALSMVEAGDTIYVRGGRYAVNERLKLDKSGKEGAWITISAYPGETPILDFAGFACQKEMPVDDWNPLASGQLQLGSSSFVRVQGLWFENMISMGITASGGQDVDVAYNTFYNAYHSSMFLGGKHVRAIGNTVLWACRTKTLKEFVDHFPELMQGKLIVEILKTGQRYRHECLDIGGTGSDGLECAYNEIAYGDKESIDCKGGPHNVKIHHNFAHHTTMTTCIYIDAWTKPMKNIEVYRNITYRTPVTGIALASEGGSEIENIFIHHNLAMEHGCSGILISRCAADGFKRNLRIENNTCIRNGTNLTNPNGEGGIHLSSASIEQAIVRNNLCVGNRDYGIARDVLLDFEKQKIFIDHNLIEPAPQAQPGPIFPGNEKLKQWMREPGDPMISGDPQFVDDKSWNFRLRPESPAIGTGKTDDGKICDLGAF